MESDLGDLAGQGQRVRVQKMYFISRPLPFLRAINQEKQYE